MLGRFFKGKISFIVAVSILVVSVASVLLANQLKIKNSVEVNENSELIDLYAGNSGLTSTEIITRAAQLLGKTYEWGAKGALNAYSRNPTFWSSTNFTTIDCSGLEFWTLGSLGISTNWTNNPNTLDLRLPVDTNHWYWYYDRDKYYNSNYWHEHLAYTGANGQRYPIKILKEEELITDDLRYYQYRDGNTVKNIPAGTVIVSRAFELDDNYNIKYDANGNYVYDPAKDHSWITLGDLGVTTKEGAQAKIKELYGLDVSLDNITEKSKTCTYWRMESPSNSTVQINNADPNSGFPEGIKRAGLIYAFQIAEEDEKVDLALKKMITRVKRYDSDEFINVTEENSNVGRHSGWNVDTSTLATSTNATYTMNKTPVNVYVGDYVEYALKIFNEGEVRAKANRIVDYIPAGLEVTNVYYRNTDILNNKTARVRADDAGNGVLNILLNNFDSTADYIEPYNKDTGVISNDEILVVCKVKDDAQGVLTNVAEITEYSTEKAYLKKDIDSTAWYNDSSNNVVYGNWTAPGNENKMTNSKDSSAWRNYANGKQNELDGQWHSDFLAQDAGLNGNKGDDDDFDKVQVINPDLALKKVITNVSDVQTIKRSSSSDISWVDVSPLNNGGTDALYSMNKTPIQTSAGSTVTYRLYVFNEGNIDLKASEITDYIPKGLKVTNVYYKDDNELNIVGLDEYDSQTEKVYYYDEQNGYLKINLGNTNELIAKYQNNTISYDYVTVKCEVNADATGVLTNMAEITKYSDGYGVIEKDIDSYSKNWKNTNGDDDNVTTDKGTSNWKNYIKGTGGEADLDDEFHTTFTGSKYDFDNGLEDDDDFEKIVITENYSVGIKKISGENSENALANIEFYMGETSYANATSEEKEAGKRVTNSEGQTAVFSKEITYNNTNDTEDVLYLKEVKLPQGSTYTIINHEFELRVKKTRFSSGLVGISEYSFAKKGDAPSYKSVSVESSYATTDANGNSVTIKVEYNNSLKQFVVTVPNNVDDSSYSLKLIKIDDNSRAPLENVGFTINTKSGTLYTNVNGKIHLGEYEITRDNYQTVDEYTITEVEGENNNYYCLKNAISLKVKKALDANSEKYIVEGISLNNSEFTASEVSQTVELKNVSQRVTIKALLAGNTITLVVPNIPKDGSYSLKIKKVDQNGRTLTNNPAGFTVVGKTAEILTNSNSGIATLISSQGITSSNVNVVDTYTIAETTVPTGFVRLKSMIYVEVNKETTNTGYRVSSVKAKYGSGQAVTINNGENKTIGNIELENGDKININVDLSNENEIVITVPNKEKHGKYNIEYYKYCLKDGQKTPISGVTFKTNNGNNEVSRTTNNSGFATLEGINIEEEGVDEYTVTEVVPDGYDYVSLKNPFNFNVTTAYDSDLEKYVVLDANFENDKKTIEAELINSDIVNLQLEINKNSNGIDVVKISVENTEIKGSYNLVFDKIEKTFGNPISGAEFTIEAYKQVGGAEQAIELYKTDGVTKVAPGRFAIDSEEGKFYISNIKIDNEEPYYIRVTEVKAPNNCNGLKAPVVIKITPKSKDGELVIESAEIVGSENDGYVKFISNNTNDTDKKVNLPGTKSKIEVEIGNDKLFDLALKKIITNVSDAQTIKRSSSSNISWVDVSPLNNGETDALYSMNKTPIYTKRGSTVTYRLYVFNEGGLDLKAAEITDYIPTGLKVTNVYYKDNVEINSVNESNYNNQSEKVYYYDEQNGYLKINLGDANELITKYQNNTISYDYVTVKCLVKDDAKGILTNMAEITRYSDGTNVKEKDVDSYSKNWKNPNDDESNITTKKSTNEWRTYVKGTGGTADLDNEFHTTFTGSVYDTVYGKEDDDDFEKVIVIEDYSVGIQKISGENSEHTLSDIEFYIGEKSYANATSEEKETGKRITNSEGKTAVFEKEVSNEETEDVIYLKEVRLPQDSTYIMINHEFQLRVKKVKSSTGVISLSEYSFTKSGDTPVYKALNRDTSLTTIDANGNRVTIEVTYDSSLNRFMVTVPNNIDDTPYKLKLVKTDSDSNEPLQNIGFTINTRQGTLLTDANGKIDFGEYEITSANYQTIDEYIITEVDNGNNGYYYLKDPINLKVKKALDINYDKYIVESISLDNSEFSASEISKQVDLKNVDKKVTIKASLEGNLITVNVPNTPKKGSYSLKVKKLNEKGETVTNEMIGFTVVTKTAEKFISTGDGTATLIDNRKITQDNKNTIDTFMIAETTVPKGFVGLNSMIRIEVEKEETNEGYRVSRVSAKYGSNSTVVIENGENKAIADIELEDGNTISIKVDLTTENEILVIVPNKEKKGKYNIQYYKYCMINGEETAIPGVVFKTVNGNFNVTKTTDNNGFALIENVIINGEGIDEYVLTEVSTGSTKYVPLKNPVKFKVLTGYDPTLEKYIVLDAYFENGEKQLTVELANDETVTLDLDIEEDSNDIDVVKVSIENTDVKGSYNLVIDKVEKLLGHPIQGAKFAIEAYKDINGQQEAIELFRLSDMQKVVPGRLSINNSDGKFTMNNIKIDNTEPYFLKITEIEAPENYIKLDSPIVVKITPKNTGERYTIESAEIIGNENDGLVKFISNKENNTDKKVEFTGTENTCEIELQITNAQFDLALRKFITSVDNKDVSRWTEPKTVTTKLSSGEETTAEYYNSKTPVRAGVGEEVIYTIRVYNEGQIDGYANKIVDHLPEQLEFLPNDVFNISRGWKYVKGSTSEIETDYLSKDRNEAENLIKAFDSKTGILDYKDVQVKCRIKNNIEVRTYITNIAEITDFVTGGGAKVTDRDSDGGNTDVPSGKELQDYKHTEIEKQELSGRYYIKGQEDDDDFEKLLVEQFDLALYKWVTEAIVTQDNETKTFDSNHTQDDKSNMVNVTIKQDNLENAVVKFKYKIKVENQGNVEGYAKEIKDHIPAGLKFVEADNIEYGWKEESDGSITNTCFEDTLLKPGDTAEVELILTWINGEDNLGQKINYAEISKDYNEYGLHDIDSSTDNFTDFPREDDEDGDVVMLNIQTGANNANTVVYIVMGVLGVMICVVGLEIVRRRS